MGYCINSAKQYDETLNIVIKNCRKEKKTLPPEVIRFISDIIVDLTRLEDVLEIPEVKLAAERYFREEALKQRISDLENTISSIAHHVDIPKGYG